MITANVAKGCGRARPQPLVTVTDKRVDWTLTCESYLKLIPYLSYLSLISA
jgi:hypothetical protein